MKQFKLLVASLAMLFSSGAMAQTDVTSTYLTNADFSASTPLTTNLMGYGKDGTPYGFQEVDGWSFEVLSGDNSNASFPNSGMGGAVFSYGSTNQVKGNSKTAPETDPDGNTGQCLAFFAVWGCGGYYYQNVTFPAGAYTLSYTIYNQSGTQNSTSYMGFIPDEGTSQTVAVNTTVGSWVTQTKTFTLTEETSGKIAVGYKSTGQGSAANLMLFIDKVTITYTDLLSGLKEELATAQAQAVSDLGSSDYANVTGDVRTALQTLSTAKVASETETAYQNLISQVNEAIAAFEAAKPLADNTAAVAGASKDNPVATNFVVNGTFDSGISPWQRTGTFSNNKTANNQQGDFTGNFYENWNGSAQVNKMYQVINNIPNGTYKLKIAAFVNTFVGDPNESQFVFANEDKTYLTTGTPTFYEVYTFVTGNTIEVGLEQTTATANWMGIDNVTLTYYGEENVVEELTANADKTAWKEALEAAQQALTDNATVVDPTKAALEAEVAKAEPTTNEAYQEAAAALRAATTAFLAAAEAYNANKDALDDEIFYAGVIGVATDDAEAVLNAATSTAADFQAAAEALKVTEYDTFAGEGTEYTTDITSTYLPAWTTNTLGSTNGQHWDGTGTTTYMDKWNGSAATFAATHTVTMPAGDYVFMAAGRGVTTIEASMTVNGTKVVYPTKGDNGKGIDTSGKTNFSADGTYANDNNGRGWEWRYITLSLTEPTEVEMKLELVLAGNTWGSFSDFKILAKPNKNMAINALITAINNANALLGEGGGDGVFQVSSADFEQAIADAEQVYNDADSKTMEEIEAATTTLEAAIDAFNAAELNAPEEGVTYYVELTDEGFAHANKPLTFKEGNAAAGGYAVGYTENPGSPYNQGVMFEPAEGKNCYYMLIKDAAGNKHYVGTGVNYGGNDSQLRMCDSKEAALVIQVENKNGDIGFINTKTNSYMGSNGDTGFYTSNNYHRFNVWNNGGISFELTFKAGKYGTAIFPFIPAAEDIAGLKFYSCEEVTEKDLVLVEVDEPVNDVPYIVENAGSEDVTISYAETAYGYATSLTQGLLTGIYNNPSAAAVPGGAYVLQTQNGIQSFYKVPEAGMTGNQYRAYLTYAGGGEINSFGFKTDETTAIRSIDAVLNGEGAEAIYNAAGARIAAPQKGLNIIKMSNGKTVKVLIK